MASATAERARCAVALFAAAAVLGVLALPMARGRVYVVDDLSTLHLSLRAFYADCLASGDGFVWFPHVYCGFYLHGDGHAGMYHPLHLLLYAALPLATAFNLELLLSYPSLFAGTYLFLRRRDLRRDAALFGALVFTFSASNLLHQVHLGTVAVVAHIPWLLLGIDLILREDDARGVARAKLGVALLTTSQMLIGWPQYIGYSLLTEALYALAVARADRRGRRLVPLVEAKVLGALGGCLQLLPTRDALAHSLRARPSSAFLAEGSLPPSNLIQLVAPYLFRSRVVTRAATTSNWTHEFGLYGGAMVPVLLAWLLIRRRSLGPHGTLAGGALILAALALVLSFGEHAFLFPIATLLPPFNLFRLPARHLVLFHFAAAVLVALAFADLAGRQEEPSGRPAWRALWPLATVPVASLAIGLGALAVPAIRPDFAYAPFLAPPALVLAGPALVGLATALVALAARGSRLALAGVVALAALDQGLYGVSFLRSEPPATPAAVAAREPPPPRPSGYRVRSYKPSDIPTMAGLRLADGYVALAPRRDVDYNSDAGLRVAGVGWRGGSTWTPVPDPLPRARLVAKAIVRRSAFGLLGRIAVEDTAVVAEEVRLPGGSPGEATLVEDRPGRVSVATEAGSRQLLVLSESYHEGWTARVDGRPRRALRVNGDFLGCIVEPGRHRVEFRFAPTSLRLGAWLTALGLALMLLSLAASLARANRAARRSGRDRGNPGTGTDAGRLDPP